MENFELVDGMASVLEDLERRMEALQVELSPLGEAPIAPRPALQQLDFVTQALGDLARLCGAAEQTNPWEQALDDSHVVKLEWIRKGLRKTSQDDDKADDSSGDLMLF